jgi:peptidoglycan/xylan/chitin deacetylase (PgdA/CDA1 family)
LDVLAQYDVKATFFVTHAFPDYEDMLAREAAEGHTVAVHTYSHDYDLIYSSADAYWEDFEEMEQVIEAQTGKRTTMFRFPGGSSNTVSNFNPGIMTYLTQDAAARGYTYFDWNVSSGDASNTVTGSEVYQNILRECQMYKENVVLCHDVKSYTVDIIDDVIEWGLANGYVFAPLTPDSYTAHHGVAN